MKVFLLLGSNLGDSKQILTNAAIQIEQKIGPIEKYSSFYETEPVGFKHENNFINQIIICQTKLEPLQVLDSCLSIEQQMGRIRSSIGYAARTLDLDLLYYDDLILDHPKLTLPHPRLHERRFTLIPLVELEPTKVHPVFKQNSEELLIRCDDRAMVSKL